MFRQTAIEERLDTREQFHTPEASVATHKFRNMFSHERHIKAPPPSSGRVGGGWVSGGSQSTHPHPNPPLEGEDMFRYLWFARLAKLNSRSRELSSRARMQFGRKLPDGCRQCAARVSHSVHHALPRFLIQARRFTFTAVMLNNILPSARDSQEKTMPLCGEQIKRRKEVLLPKVGKGEVLLENEKTGLGLFPDECGWAWLMPSNAIRTCPFLQPVCE